MSIHWKIKHSVVLLNLHNPQVFGLPIQLTQRKYLLIIEENGTVVGQESHDYQRQEDFKDFSRCHRYSGQKTEKNGKILLHGRRKLIL